METKTNKNPAKETHILKKHAETAAVNKANVHKNKTHKEKKQNKQTKTTTKGNQQKSTTTTKGNQQKSTSTTKGNKQTHERKEKKGIQKSTTTTKTTDCAAVLTVDLFSVQRRSDRGRETFH